MAGTDLLDRGPLRTLITALHGGLRVGEVGVVRARPGTGKTALVVQFALERLLRGEPVLHLSIHDSIDTTRDAYDSLLAGLAGGARPIERAEARLQVERHRMIHYTRGSLPTAASIDALLETLDLSVEFKPRMVIIDGTEPTTGEWDAVKAMADRRELAVWYAVRSYPETAGLGDVSIELVPERTHVWLHARRVRGTDDPMAPLRLDAATFTAREEIRVVPSDARLKPAECTLFSGGAHGAESAFGDAAERWGVREINLTFDGHVQARTRGAHPLTEQELAAGDVSLAYVARRLRRGYGEGTMIKRVLQSLWHQVSRAQIVFVIGIIQEDGTVTGGTGWSVELARMWNKRLWVFDQEKEAWYRWNGEDWVEGVPTLDGTDYCGTGTRYLLPSGREAIDALMERSFGALV